MTFDGKLWPNVAMSNGRALTITAVNSKNTSRSWVRRVEDSRVWLGFEQCKEGTQEASNSLVIGGRDGECRADLIVICDITLVTTSLPLRLSPRHPLHPSIPPSLSSVYHHDAGSASCYGRCSWSFASRLTTVTIFASRPFCNHQPPHKTQRTSYFPGNSRHPLQHACCIAVYETTTTKRISFNCSECCWRDG